MGIVVGFLAAVTGFFGRRRNSRLEADLFPVTTFGFAKGWVMSMDRLMRCGRDETRIAPKIWVNGKLKYYDPIERNDLWHSQAIN